MRVLTGLVYLMKSRGPRTEPWGTSQKEVYTKDRSLSHLSWRKRGDKYDFNQ